VKRSEVVYAVRLSSECWRFADKIGRDSEGAGVVLKAYVKYENIGSGTK